MWIDSTKTSNDIQQHQIITMRLHNQDILITKVGEDIFACKDLCPHEEVKISLGCIQNSRLKCSLHGFTFDLTTGECDNNDVENLHTYPVKIEHNTIFVDIT
jgi:3-phenylpropionate/trans-cinnamate dioxygenase ferredoxin subunit